jgi:type 1 glutamine amidotransferase
MSLTTTLLAIVLVAVSGSALAAGEPKTKIVLIGKERDHPPETHEYMAECRLLAKCLRQTPGVEAVVSKGWPTDLAVLKDADAIAFYTKQAGNVLLNGPRRTQAQELLKRGVGLTAIHWSTGAQGDEVGKLWMGALGGWFHNSFSMLKTTTLKLTQVDKNHPICRGWSNYDLHDEYYLKLRFAAGMKPVMAVTFEGTDYVVGWVYERPDSKGGRSFGCVLGHFHKQFGMEPFRRSLVNGILWTAHRDVPEAGAPCKISAEDMQLPPDPRKKK